MAATPQEPSVQFIGLKELPVFEQDTVQSITQEYTGKFNRMSVPFNELTVHVKCHNTEGVRKKYSVNVRIKSSKHTFESHTHDWLLSPILHKVFEELIAQMHHKLHTDVTRPR